MSLMQLCGCLMLLLTVAHGSLVENQMSHFARVHSLVYKGSRLRCYKHGGVRIVEPYISMRVPARASVRREPLGNGYYFSVQLRISNGIRLPHTYKMLKVHRFKVQLRQPACRTKCPKVRVMAVWKKSSPMVRFSCDSRRDCQRLLRSVQFKGERNDRLRESLRFKFFGDVNGVNYQLSRVGVPVVNSMTRPYAKEFWFEGNKLLLFTIKANIGLSAYATFNSEQNYAIPRDGSLPPVYRSHLLDQLSKAAKSATWEIVAEMRKAGRTVAQVVFNGNPSGLNKNTWFSASRLISSKPFWIGHTGFNFFSVAGDAPNWRRFFINRHYGGCHVDTGFWVVSDKKDPCPWGKRVFKGRAPALIYQPYDNLPYQTGSPKAADNFLVYMRLARPPVRSAPALRNAFYFEKNKILLFTVTAASNNIASDIFLNSGIKHKVPRNKKLPTLFRSELIDTLSTAYKRTGMHHIVAEMRAGRKMVAQVVFDISSRRSTLNKENWFSKDRVVSSYPYPLGNKFNFFSIRGHSGGSSLKRSFFISFNYGGCPKDSAFWVVSERRDPCKWAQTHWTGRSPNLIYTTSRARSLQTGGAKYDANRFLVYLM